MRWHLSTKKKIELNTDIESALLKVSDYATQEEADFNDPLSGINNLCL